MCQSSPPREVLPTNVKPLRYGIVLEPNFTTFEFDGELDIDMRVQADSTTIVLNSVEIEIHSAEINGSKIDKFDFDKEKQIVTFHLGSKLPKDSNATLSLKFTGLLNEKMAGFYRSSYEDASGKTAYLATTQMQATDCRRAFPSFDEPALKAKFDISLISDAKLVHLSNMDEKEVVQLPEGKKKTIFNTTPLMSTYLVAFIVGDMKYVENKDYSVPIKVWTTPGSENLGQYSADLAADALKFFDEKFDIPYQLPKLDMVAIHDFAAGAMENYGCITFRTSVLLLEPEASGTVDKQRVTEVVIHELAHQWFGNLVTMDFWDGLWLNEGFATWMSWYACDHLFPEWKVWESYVDEALQDALSLDSLRSSHPIEIPVKKVHEINQIFDAISYCKGSSLLKMISHWLGEDTFITGVSKYLKKFKWGSTQTSDLWDSLSEVSGKDVVKVMDIWTKKVGFPVVHVKENGDDVTFTQHRFLVTNDITEDDDKVLYPVFLGIKTSAGVDDSEVLDTRTKTLKLDIPDDFFKVNSNQAGLYRTAYSPERWAKLGQAGVDGKLTVEDRVGLIADAGALAKSGLISATELLRLIKSWSAESNYVVWATALHNINKIRGALLFEEEKVTKALRKFLLDFVSPKFEQVGWTFSESDSFADQKLKTLLFSNAVALEHKKALEFVDHTFDAFVKGEKSAIDPNLRSSIFRSVASRGGADEFDKLYQIYQNTKSVEVKNSALRSLGSFEKDEILDKFTAMLLKTDIIKSQDIYTALNGMRSHTKGVEKLWQWLSTNWDEICKVWPPDLSMLGSVVSLATSNFTKEEQKKKVEDFFANKDTKGYDQSLARVLESVGAKCKWAKRDTEKIYKWLKEEEGRK